MDGSGVPARTRVLIFLTSTAGGAGLHAYLLAKHLSREAFDTTAAFGPGYLLDEPFQELDIPVEILSISRKISPLTNLRGFFQVYRLMRRRRIDVLCTECSIAGMLGRLAARLAGVPATVHVIQVYASRPYQNRLSHAVYRWIERRLDRFTTRYVAVSEATKRYGVDSGIMPEDKVDVIYNAVDLDDKTRLPAEEARRELGVDAEAPIVGTLSRCETQKGLEYMIRAAALVKKKVPKVEFMIVGDGPLRPSLEALAEDLDLADTVRFLGWRSDVTRVLSGMDVFCLSSLWEQAPLALAEAMSMELPVVATAVDGTPEMVADGVTGVLVPAEDPPALAAGLISLLEDPTRARQFGQAGRRRMEVMFAVDQMVRKFEGVFDDVLASVRAPSSGRPAPER